MLEAFLGGAASIPTAWDRSRALHSPLSVAVRRICLPDLPTGLEDACVPEPSPPRPPIASSGPKTGNAVARDGNLDPLSIAYGSRPRLRPASPAADQHGGGTLGHAVGGIRAPLALLMPTFALPSAPPRLPPRLLCCWGRSPTMTRQDVWPSAASVAGLSPGGLSAPRHITPVARDVRPVSYYALFQGWLLLSQPPGCLRAATTLPT